MATAAGLVAKALESGEWVEVQDPRTGRFFYHHPATNNVTRDLRMELLRGFNPMDTPARHNESSAAAGLPANTTPNASLLKEPTLEEQLAASKELNRRYELEILHLRHSLFADTAAPLPPAPSSAAALAERPSSYPTDVDALRRSWLVAEERVKVLQDLSSRLLERVAIDRETRLLCGECGRAVDDPEVLEATRTEGLGAASTAVSRSKPLGPRLESMQPFALRAGDELRLKQTVRDGPHAGPDGILRRLPAYPSAVDECLTPTATGSYLPASLAPTHRSTTHAPLNTLPTSPPRSLLSRTLSDADGGLLAPTTAVARQLSLSTPRRLAAVAGVDMRSVLASPRIRPT